MKYLLSAAIYCFAMQVGAQDVLTITGVDVYPAPGAVKIIDANIEIQDGRIRKITSAGEPPAGNTVDGSGLTASFGFWNSHVHFTDPQMQVNPQRQLDDMLLKFGFTQVLDTGSLLTDTLRLKQNIQDKNLRGPYIYTANGSFVYRDGTPAYLPPELKLPEALTPEIGQQLAKHFLAQGADGIKIFSGSFQTPALTIYLPVDVIKAIAETAHAQNSFVVAHPTTVLGLSNAVQSGVDVIAHTTSSDTGIPANILQQMQENKTALIPTLSLWRYEMMRFTGDETIADAVEAAAVEQLRRLRAANIEILFGTDVGYMTQFDTTGEYRLMERAGMDWPLIHHALTVGPARRFSNETAVLEEGGKANLVLLDGDPAKDITALARVAYTFIDGQIVYQR